MSEWGLRQVQAEVLRRVGAALAVFCFLDYDGTLSPLAPTPAEAMPLPGTAAVLRALAAAQGVQVAVVTGRPVAEVRRLLDVPGLYYVGLHGLEVRLPGGETQLTEAANALKELIPAIKRKVQHAVGGRPGIVIEDKGAALACHYRLASPADAERARQAMAEVVHEYHQRGAPVMLAYGHEVAEARLPHVNKGKTACALLAAYAPTALPVYIGDDQTDEDAFRLLPPATITVSVDPLGRPTRARFQLATPDEVHQLLRVILASRESAGGAYAEGG
jgi:trehalose 6-phosphate phosphatase